jgi:hypothetical protein
MRVHTSKLRPLFLPAVLSSLPCASLVSTVTVDLSASRAIVGMSFGESCSCALTDTHKSATTVRKVALGMVMSFLKDQSGLLDCPVHVMRGPKLSGHIRGFIFQYGHEFACR